MGCRRSAAVNVHSSKEKGDLGSCRFGRVGSVQVVTELGRALEEAKKVEDGPVIVHALTTKGKGFPNPEKNYYAYHATGPFDPKTGLPYKSGKPSLPPKR